QCRVGTTESPPAPPDSGVAAHPVPNTGRVPLPWTDRPAEKGIADSGDRAPAGDASLDGAWKAVTVETNGVAAPAEFANRIQWRFASNSLMIKGVTPVGEVPCAVTLDRTATPNTIDYQDLGTKQRVLGIYELRGDQLEVCII